MHAFDDTRTELEQVELDAKSLRGIERDPAVRVDAEVEHTIYDRAPDVQKSIGRRNNIHVFGFLGRRVGNARCAANEDDLVAKAGTDEANGCGEAGEECFTEGGGDDDLGRHVSEQRDEEGWGNYTHCEISEILDTGVRDGTVGLTYSSNGTRPALLRTVHYMYTSQLSVLKIHSKGLCCSSITHAKLRCWIK